MLKSVVRVKNSTIIGSHLARIVTKITIPVSGFVICMDLLEHLVSVATLALAVWLFYDGTVDRVLPLVGF